MPAWAPRLSIPASALQSSVLRAHSDPAVTTTQLLLLLPLLLLLRRHRLSLNRGHPKAKSLAAIVIHHTVPGRRATKQARWSIRFRCRVPLSQQRGACSAARSKFRLRLALELCNELQTAGGSDDLEASKGHSGCAPCDCEYLHHAGRTRSKLRPNRLRPNF